MAAKELTVEPSGAAGLDLRLQRQIGAHRKGDALPAGGIFKAAQLDDAARRGVGRRVEVGQADMVRAPIHAVDHGVGRAFELVVEAACDKPPDDRLCCVLLTKRKVADAALDALCGQSAMDALDDVGAFAQRPHGGLGVLRQVPSCWTKRLGEAKALELLHAADHDGASGSVDSGSLTWPKIYDPVMLGSLAGKRAIEPSPSIGLDLGLEILTDIKVAARSKLEGGEMRGAGAQALADVVAGDDEVPPVVGFAAHDDMDVGIVRIPVVDPDPVEPGTEIPLGLRHQVSGKRPEVGKLLGVLRRYDEPKMMPVLFAAIGKRAVVGVIVLGVEHSADSAVLRHALPPQVGEVRAERRSPRLVAHHARLDSDVARPVRH